ncbi:MAG: class I SAM-dependent methyltransferase [Candidatus Theseobacter exili]|nr:class I SAM-dependent methyltransferase [Candidatus Theseobacter exili]
MSVFDIFYRKYDAWYDRNRFAYLSELEALKRVIPKEARGVEIGVGTGRFAVPLGIRFGVEPSFEMAFLAKERGVEVFQATAEQLPFPDLSFDFAVMVTTICFLDNIVTAFGEVYRVLKTNGQLIIGFVDKNSSLGKLYQKNKAQSVFYSIANFYSTDEVLSYLKKTGFSEFAFRQTIFHDLREIKKVEPVINGCGKGSYVVIKAKKEG